MRSCPLKPFHPASNLKPGALAGKTAPKWRGNSQFADAASNYFLQFPTLSGWGKTTKTGNLFSVSGFFHQPVFHNFCVFSGLFRFSEFFMAFPGFFRVCAVFFLIVFSWFFRAAENAPFRVFPPNLSQAWKCLLRTCALEPSAAAERRGPSAPKRMFPSYELIKPYIMVANLTASRAS